jgi:soluble lytic murein transglycosylase-like protein
MKKPKIIKQLLGVVALLSISFSSFAASCDQQHVNVLHQKAYIYNPAIAAAAMKYRVNPALIKAVITAESCFRNEASSNKGAGGLMQLMPATAARFGVYDRFDPYQNIDGGTRYLRWLLNRYGGSLPHAIAAYNAGEGRVDYYGAAVPIQETAVYTRRVLNAYSKLASNGRTAQAQRVSYNRAVQASPVLVSYRPQPQPKPAPKPESRFQWDEYATN